MRKNKRCPECGGSEIYAAEVTARDQYINLLPDILSGMPRTLTNGGATLDAYICGECGYHRIFVPEEHLEAVRTKYYRA